MYQEFSVPVSYAGGISMIISAGTIFSSIMSDRLTKSWEPTCDGDQRFYGTAAALFRFSVSHSYIALCLWAVPYGLGAGSVDASLNNFVALHYTSRHMSWLHCMWALVRPSRISWGLRSRREKAGIQDIAIFRFFRFF